MALVLKRIVLVLGLWLFLSAATIRCSSGTFQDDDDKDGPDRNRAPVASNSFLQTSLNQDLSDRMQATDPDGDPLTFRVTAGPDRGSLTRLDDRGFFTYRPAELGSDQFSFRANDGELDSNTAQVVIRSTLTAAGAAGRSKPERAGGLAGVYPDDARHDALLVLWDGSDGSLQSVPGTGAGPIETRLERVAAVAADPWQAGRLVALQTDGNLVESHDAGLSWASRGRLAPPGRGAELALSDTRVVIARAAPACGAGVPAPTVTGTLAATEVCGHAPFVGPDNDAYVLSGESGNGLLVSVHATESPPAGRILGRGVIRAGSDPRRPGRVWVLKTGPNGERLGVSDDAGLHWAAPVPLPSGRGVDALADAAGRLWVVTVAGDDKALIYRLEGRTWTAVTGVAAVAGRLHRCGGRMCLLDSSGRRLWRLPQAVAPDAPPPG